MEHPVNSSQQDELKSTSLKVPEVSSCNVKLVTSNEPPVEEAEEVAYEGEDEKDDKSPMSRENSDSNLQACDIDSSNPCFEFGSPSYPDVEAQAHEIGLGQTGHVSDPGMAREERWTSPTLTRSCSSLDTREVLQKIADHLPPSKTQSYEKLQELANKVRDDVLMGSPCSQSSVLSHRSADNKPVLPPKTRVSFLAAVNQQGGYSSDTLEPYRVKQLRKVDSAGSFSEQCSYKSSQEEDKGFKGGFSGLWPQNQWIAFSGESSSPFKRIDDWVKDIEIQPTISAFEEDDDSEEIIFPSSPEASGSTAKNTAHSSRQNKIILSEELLHANSVIQSLNSSSTVAHISGMGLKAIPIISHFSSLRSINLSNNSIGLSGCTLLKELYLAGNKIGEVEGLHRLLKLTVLDLSFNKLTTAKALGQLVANYNSLVGLNILGNPIHSNLSSEQLRRAVTGLLPKLAYLNKQPVNQQKAREVSMDIVAKTSSRNSNWNARRKSVKKSSQSGAMLSSAARSTASVGQRSKNKSKRQVNQQSRLRRGF
ncbi:Dynein assembly factor 1 axonemal [Bienertia sinuspersici]